MSTLERGGPLPSATIAYETWGELNADASNAVLVLHALTGDSHLTGPAGPGHPTAGWWSGLVGAGRALDPAEWFVVAPNMLGGCQGSTGPASLAPDGVEWGPRFPYPRSATRSKRSGCSPTPSASTGGRA